jgi:RNA 3'-terminal phosphate cyclase (ATP)
MALANGVSRIKTGPVTLHTQTAIHFAEQLAKVSIPLQRIIRLYFNKQKTQ